MPAYRSIYESVISRGKTGLSAAISIYYAARYLMVQNCDAPKAMRVPEAKNSGSSDKQKMISDYDFRKRWPASYRCEDGHYVRSKNEQLVDNWLYHHNVCHGYEPLVVDKKTGRECISDFYIPKMELFIEVWGFETEEYLQRKARKIETYQANDLQLLQITDQEIKNIDDYLRRHILSKL